MFGLMNFYNCSFGKIERDIYRRHYCGVCKTLGKFYSQKIRFLVNRDFVFLSEILSDMSELDFSEDLTDHCFDLPKDGNTIPLSLQIAAAINVLYAEYKIKDNIVDAKYGKRLWWKFIRFMFSKEFDKVTHIMEQWHFPMEEVYYWINEQKKRESNGFHTADPEEAIHYYAESTAVITGLAFQHGTKIIGRDDKAENMYVLGHTFGRLLYLLDALDDFEEDYSKKTFNALRVAYHNNEAQLETQNRNKSIAMVQTLEKDMQQALSKLDISENKTLYLKKRLDGNVKRKLGLTPCLPGISCDVDKVKQRMRMGEKWKFATELGKKLVVVSNENKRISTYKRWLVSPVLTVLIFLTPQMLFGNIESQLQLAAAKTGTDIGFWGPVFLFFFALGLANGNGGDGDSDGNRCVNWCVENCVCCRWIIEKCCEPVIKKCVEAVCGSICDQCCKNCQDGCNNACSDWCNQCGENCRESCSCCGGGDKNENTDG